MILDASFSKEWIQSRRKAYAGADPSLIEKQIYAFELLHRLANSGRQFVFKGGTSLHLMLPDHRRLSTDLDIVGAFTIEELAELIEHSRFSRVEENIRERSVIPKRHFKCYYTSAVDGRETYVLLDTLEEHHPYPKTEVRPIASRLFETDGECTVRTPSLEGILGDKLTVFAPHTVGIPFGAGKSMEIIKQLFDIGALFDHATDIKDVIETYNATHALESGYRSPIPDRATSLGDTINVSYLITQFLLKGHTATVETAEIAAGLRQIENHLLGVTFNIVQARIAASKAAFLASLARSGRLDYSLEKSRFDASRIQELMTNDLSGSLKILNRLKRLEEAEAFHYWWLISRL